MLSMTRGAAILGWMVSATLVSTFNAQAGGPERSAAATPPPGAAPAVAMLCQPALKVVGSAAKDGPYVEMQARHNAIESWRSQVSDRLGRDYGQWWRAREKAVSCQQVGAAAGGGMQCEALAVPCMAPGSSAADMAAMSGLGGANR